MTEKILVVGGAGLVGSKVVAKLLALGHEVSVFDFSLPSAGATMPQHVAYRAQFLSGCTHVVQGDVGSANDLERSIESVRPDRIVHLAAVPHPPEDDVSRRAALGTTLPPIEMMLSLTRGYLKQFIYGSTSNIYGDFQYAPADERHPRDPSTVYGSLKLAGELYTRALANDLKVPYSIVRLITVYGPGGMSGKITMPKLLRILQTGEYPTGSRSDTSGTDYTYVDDVAEGIVRALLMDAAAGETFNIARGHARTAGEVIGVLNALGFNVHAVAKVEAARSPSPKRGALSIEKARDILGYAPQVDLEQGLASCIAYLSQYEGLKDGTAGQRAGCTLSMRRTRVPHRSSILWSADRDDIN